MKHHENAHRLTINTSQYIAWGQSPDEALQNAIAAIFTEASDDMQADLFAQLCEAEDFEVTTVQAIIEKTFA